jgi:hypothetical protein
VNDIRYVSLSDLHLGAENSILTRLTSVSNGIVKLKADPTTASDVMVRLVDCLRLLISQNHGPQKPTLILNGDALELALADVNVASMVFERFMELTMKPGEELFDKTIYYNPATTIIIFGKLPEKRNTLKSIFRAQNGGTTSVPRGTRPICFSENTILCPATYLTG